MGLWWRLGVELLLFWHWRMFVLFWGGFAMQSRQRFVRQPPLPLDDFST